MKKIALGLIFCLGIFGCGMEKEDTQNLQAQLLHLQKEKQALKDHVKHLQNKNRELAHQLPQNSEKTHPRSKSSPSDISETQCPSGQTPKQGKCVCAPGFTRAANGDGCISVQDLEKMAPIKVAEEEINQENELLTETPNQSPPSEIIDVPKVKTPAENFFEKEQSHNTNDQNPTSTENELVHIQKKGCEKEDDLKSLYAQETEVDFYRCDFTVTFDTEEPYEIDLNGSFFRYLPKGGFEKEVDMPATFEGEESTPLLTPENGQIQEGHIWIQLPESVNLKETQLEHIFFLKKKDELVESLTVS